jgi:hypothetical protein
MGHKHRTVCPIALDEVDRPPRNLRVDQAALLQVINLKFAALLTLLAFHDVLENDARRLRCHVRRCEDFIRGTRDPIPFVEALIVRQPALFTAKMPLAEMAGGITSTGE